MQTAIIYASIIGTILNEYDHSEQTNAINQIRSDVRKLMSSRSKSNHKEWHEAVMLADEAWKKAINHFVKHKLSIEAIRAVANIYAAAPDELKKYANITQKKIDKLERSAKEGTGFQIENNSHIVSDYLVATIRHMTGADIKSNGLAALKRKAQTKANLAKMDDILSEG